MAAFPFVLVGAPEGDFDSPSPIVLYAARKYDSADGALALTRLFSDRFGLRPRDGVRFVEINAIATHEHQAISIPHVLTYAVSESNVISQPDDTVTNYLYFWLRDPKQWRVQRLKYLPANIQYQGTNAIYGRFSLSVDKEDNK